MLAAVEPSCVKFFGGNDSDEAIEAARLFCSQWADGPQLYGVGVGENGERYLQTAWPAQGWADRRNGQIPYSKLRRLSRGGVDHARKILEEAMEKEEEQAR